MRIGMISFGDMGAQLTPKLLLGGHECVVLNSSYIVLEVLLRIKKRVAMHSYQKVHLNYQVAPNQ